MVLKVSLNTGINRIRLEFKDIAIKAAYSLLDRINRIRLEFKDSRSNDSDNTFTVLIESDWNLKYLRLSVYYLSSGINRIRLEFKVASGQCTSYTDVY